MTLLDDALARVKKPKRDGEWFQGFCPVHENNGNGTHHPSLRLRDSTKFPNGVVVTCMAGCSREDLQAALGLTGAKVKTSPSDENTHLFYDPPDDDVVAVYDYTDEKGKLLYQKVRFAPKRFVQRAADGTYKLDGIRRVLYHLPEVVAADTVYVCEGEKAVEAVRKLGLTATCSSGGKMKWPKDLTPSLIGKRVVVLPDNDEPGREGAMKVIAALRHANVECCTVRLPDLPPKGDPYDAVQNGLTADQLEEYAAEALERRDEKQSFEAYKELATEYRLTEGGNSERFADEHQDSVAYVPEWRKLVVYEGGIFADDPTAIERYAIETVRHLYEASAKETGDTSRRALAEHAKRSDTTAARSNMVKGASSSLKLRVPEREFDANPELFCVKNGVVDLRTGVLHPHSPKYRMTRMAGASYDIDAPCPLWLSHLNRIFDGDQQLISFLQRLMGYALTGYTREQLFAVFYGSGANGKSVTMHRIEEAMGDYAKTAASSSLSQSRTSGGGTREDIVRLRAARLVSTFESEDRKNLDAELVKQLTGGDKIAARSLYKGTTEFRPEFLVVMSTNHKPTVEVADYAIKRRVLLMPFEVTIPEEERDPAIEHKLQAEIDGILSWCVVGAVAYLNVGLQIPEHVRAATDEYREEMDPMSGFRDCITFDGSAWTATAHIRSAVDLYCKEEGIRPPSGRELHAWLEKLGAHEHRRKKARGWTGIVVEGCTYERTLDDMFGGDR